MRIAIAAGGTGGHIYPGIAIAEELKDKDPKNSIVFIGSYYGLEKTLIPKEGYRIKLIHAKGIVRTISFKALSALFISIAGFIESLIFLSTFKPQCVIVTGGYVSFPVAIAAKLLGIKIYLHEQNVLPGFTARIISRFADKIILSFEESLKYMEGVVLGNPVRKRIRQIKRQEPIGRHVLIVGGSQGARSINKTVFSNIGKFRDAGVEVFHIIGDRDYKALNASDNPFYHPISYMYNMEEALAKVDMVVSRAGATAIAEFLSVGLPSILVPFPYAAENHQELNAKAIEGHGAAKCLLDGELAKLPDMIIGLVSNKEMLRQMGELARNICRQDAAKDITDLIYAKTSD